MALAPLLDMQLSFRFVILILLFVGTSNMLSQEESLESILANLQNESNITLAMEDLERIMNFPIDLRSASKQDLIELPTINIELAEDISFHFKNNPNSTIQELANKLKLSRIQIQILNLATSNSKKTTNEEFKSSKVGNSFRYYSRMSFDNLNSINSKDGYQGNAYDNTNKLFLSLNSMNTQIGIATKKDYYEPNSIDNITGFVKLKMDGFNLHLGNFQINSANGLVFGRGMTANKGTTDNDIISNSATKVNSYTGTSDYLPFRGIAFYDGTTIKSTSFGLLLFVSNKQVSYSLDSNGNGQTLQRSGLYRDSNEISRKGNTSISEIGTCIEFGTNYIISGLNFIGSLYSREINFDNRLLNITTNASLFLRENSPHPKFILEIARDFQSNYAVNGTYRFDYQKGNVLGFARYYGKNYRAMYSRALGEYSNNQNELGFYLANELNLENYTLYLYLDVFSQSSRDIELPLQKKGYELFQSIKTSFSDKLNAKLVLRFKKQNDYQKIDFVYKQDDREKFQSRIEFESKSIETLTLKFWLAYNQFNSQLSKANGSEIGFDLKYRPFEETMIGIRYSHFSIDSFDAAIWSYEQIYPNYGFSPVLTGYGNRNQIYINQKVGENLRLWLRYLDYSSLKFSLDEFEQVANNKFNLQMDINF